MAFQLEFHTFPSRSTSDNPHSKTHFRTTVDGLWCRASKQKAHLLNRAQSAAWQSQHRRGVYLKDTNRVRSLDRWIAVPQSFSPSVRLSIVVWSLNRFCVAAAEMFGIVGLAAELVGCGCGCIFEMELGSFSVLDGGGGWGMGLGMGWGACNDSAACRSVIIIFACGGGSTTCCR